jgi:hypothetical protein
MRGSRLSSPFLSGVISLSLAARFLRMYIFITRIPRRHKFNGRVLIFKPALSSAFSTAGQENLFLSGPFKRLIRSAIRTARLNARSQIKSEALSLDVELGRALNSCVSTSSVRINDT